CIELVIEECDFAHQARTSSAYFAGAELYRGEDFAPKRKWFVNEDAAVGIQDVEHDHCNRYGLEEVGRQRLAAKPLLQFKEGKNSFAGARGINVVLGARLESNGDNLAIEDQSPGCNAARRQQQGNRCNQVRKCPGDLVEST